MHVSVVDSYVTRAAVQMVYVDPEGYYAAIDEDFKFSWAL